ncbi:MAG TPA: ATPase, partial [Bifidobacterium sp.]|nr:ATPase [Bifidobacterium sp.]
AAARGISIEMNGDGSLCINGDAEQIRAAVAKLVENAIAYSPDRTTVNV